MREIRLSGSEGGGTGNSTGPPYPYPKHQALAVGAGRACETHPPKKKSDYHRTSANLSNRCGTG